MRHCSRINPTSCHSHTIESYVGTGGDRFTTEDHEFPSHLELSLTATDSQGATGTTTLRLDPETFGITLASQPTGASVVVGSDAFTAPYVAQVIRNGVVSISAPSSQLIGGVNHEFVSWSDGGARSHNVTATAATTLTATYEPVATPTTPGFLRLSGAVGGFVSTPDSVPLSLVGDLDLRADLSMSDWTPGVVRTVIGKHGNTGQKSYRLAVAASGSLQLQVFADGSTPVTLHSVVPGFVDGQRYQLRATIDINNAGTYVVQFYRRDPSLDLTSNTGWQLIGGASTGPALSGIFNSTSALRIGNNGSSGANELAGNVYQTVVMSGIGGTVVSNLDFRSTAQLVSSPPNYTQWVDQQANPWTVSGSTTTYTPPS